MGQGAVFVRLGGGPGRSAGPDLRGRRRPLCMRGRRGEILCPVSLSAPHAEAGGFCEAVQSVVSCKLASSSAKSSKVWF